jgi:hypothetical protein
MNTEDTRFQPRPELHWVKSSYSSGAGGECVEVAVAGGAVHVRDSKLVVGGGPLLRVGTVAWSVMLETM